MQDHFLFDDEDPKQVGHGCDALCRNDKRLRCKWMWVEDWRCSVGPSYELKAGKKRSPGQTSEALLSDGWRLVAIFWHSEYEAFVERYGKSIASYHVHYDEETKKFPFLKTRIDAQIKAEEIFRSFILKTLIIAKKIGLVRNGE